MVCELVTDAQGVIASAAEGAAELFAIDERYLVGKPLASFVADGDVRRFRMLLLELPEGQEAELSLALAPRHRENIAASVVANRTDGRIHWTLRAEDVTAAAADDDSLSVEELARSERWAVRLLTRLPQALVVVDRELRVVFVNPASRRLLRQTIRVGEPLPDPWPVFPLRENARSLFGRRPAVARRIFDAGGRILSVQGLTSSDRLTATLIIADVTHDERVRRSEQQFVENAAHELRTPIAAILSAAEALESGAKDEPAVRDQFLRHIRQQADRLARLAASLLVLRRVHAGVGRPHLDLVPARALLEDAAAQLEPASGVAVRVEGNAKLAMLADRDLLRHAVDNVAANAARHTREGEIVLLARDAGTQTELEIRDTGSGMSPEDLDSAFIRLHHSRGSGGAGLGLPIAKEAVEALGGSIEIESEPGAGTRVRMRLPTARLLD